MARVRSAVIAAAVAAACAFPSGAAGSGAAALSGSTFTIVAADTVEHEWGVATSSRLLAAGSIVPWARAGVGAVASQAAANPGFGPQALAFMERGEPAPDALRRLLRTDPDAGLRQVALIDAEGTVALHTGDGCPAWSGGVKGRRVVVLGTALARPEVLDALLRAYEEAEGSLAERLLAAVTAGEEAADGTGRSRSAALLVVKAGGGYRGGNDRLVDVRVDDHASPAAELARVYRLHAAFHLPAAHTRLGDDLLAAGHRAQAERAYARVVHLYRQAIAAFPTDARFPNGLAWFFVQHRVNLDDAFRLADAAHRLDGASWEVEDTLAEIHFARGNPAQARAHALAALKIEPNNAYLKNQVSRFEEALEMSERR